MPKAWKKRSSWVKPNDPRDILIVGQVRLHQLRKLCHRNGVTLKTSPALNTLTFSRQGRSIDWLPKQGVVAIGQSRIAAHDFDKASLAIAVYLGITNFKENPPQIP